MSIVLAVEPDSTQANLLRKILRGRIDADLLVVSTKDAAIDAISGAVPDLVLVSTLLAPRDEDALFAHLRSLDEASHLQTLNIPQLRRRRQTSAAKGAFGRFRKKPAVAAPTGCDPSLFLQEVQSYLARAQELKSHPPASSAIAGRVFPSFGESAALACDVVAEAAIEQVAAPLDEFATPLDEFAVPLDEFAAPTFEPPVMQAPELAPAPEEWVDLDVNQLIQHLGLESPRVEVRERQAELAQAEAEAQATLTAEIERVQQEAEAHRRVELARVQAEAEAERTLAVNQARAEAEQQARNALAVELTRMRNDAEQMLAEAEEARLSELARVQAEANERCDVAAREAREAAETAAAQAMRAELARVRQEVEQTLNGQLDRARAEAEELRTAELARVHAQAEGIRAAAAEEARIAAEAAASRALEAEVTKVRAEAETRLLAELDVIRQEAVRMRLAEQSEARQSAEKVREAALRDTRAIAEAANHTLESELRRVRAEADTRLEAELKKARAHVEQQRATELDEIRAQVAEMREAAALHARTAAAEAIASEVARAAAEALHSASRRPPSVGDLQATTELSAHARVATEPVVCHDAGMSAQEISPDQDSGDYYNLWKFKPEPAPTPEPVVELSQPPQDFLAIVRSARAKWAALPAAAAMLLILNEGLSTGRGWKPDATTAGPAVPAAEAVVTPVNAGVRFGEIQIDAIPAGTRVTLDGAEAGQTPLNLSGVKPGKHTIILQSSAGTVTRRVTVRPGETARVSESIFSGWLAVFSGVPLKIAIDGKPRGTTEDGQLMLPPGAYNVQLSSDQLNYHETRSVRIEPGQVVSYSVQLPVTPIHLDAPDGMEVAIDGQRAGTTPLPDLTVQIGTHEISGRGADGNERRRSVEAKSGAPAEVSLK